MCGTVSFGGVLGTTLEGEHGYPSACRVPQNAPVAVCLLQRLPQSFHDDQGCVFSSFKEQDLQRTLGANLIFPCLWFSKRKTKKGLQIAGGELLQSPPQGSHKKQLAYYSKNFIKVTVRSKHFPANFPEPRLCELLSNSTLMGEICCLWNDARIICGRAIIFK